MGEEVRISGGEDDYRVLEWEAGLPNVDDLTPLSQSLISADLLSAFSITPEPYRNMFDVNRASRNTLSNLRGELEQQSVSKLKSFGDDKEDEMVVEAEETADLTDSRKLQRVDNDGDGDGGGAGEEFDSDPSARASKRPRLVWTPQLHKRFVEVVAHLGVTNAVPKTIMQLMNVEGLSRENVASHLQKYRLYLKRMQTQGPSSSDQLFASTPAPQNIHQSSSAAAGNGYHHAPMHYQMVPMPYQSPQIDRNSAGGSAGAYHHGFESNSYPYNTTMQQRDWSGNNFGSVSAYQHRMTSNDK